MSSESNGHVTEDQPAMSSGSNNGSTKNRVAEFFAANPAAKIKDAAAALGVSLATVTNTRSALGLSVAREPRAAGGKKKSKSKPEVAKVYKAPATPQNLDPLRFIPSADCVRRQLREQEQLTNRLRVLLEVAERIESGDLALASGESLESISGK